MTLPQPWRPPKLSTSPGSSFPTPPSPGQPVFPGVTPGRPVACRGPPLFTRSTDMLRMAARLSRGRLVLIGCGGVRSGADVLAKICAGASLVQFYTAFAYEGPALLSRLKTELLSAMKEQGFHSGRAGQRHRRLMRHVSGQPDMASDHRAVIIDLRDAIHDGLQPDEITGRSISQGWMRSGVAGGIHGGTPAGNQERIEGAAKPLGLSPAICMPAFVWR